MAYDWAEPMTPLWTQMRAWCLETLKLARVAPRMGLLLFPLSSPPACRHRSCVWCAPSMAAARLRPGAGPTSSLVHCR